MNKTLFQWRDTSPTVACQQRSRQHATKLMLAARYDIIELHAPISQLEAENEGLTKLVDEFQDQHSNKLQSPDGDENRGNA